MTSPAFHLPACALCSSLVYLNRPYWHCARNTSEKRKKGCYIWVGCRHAQTLSPAGCILDDPNDWAKVEELWTAKAETLLADKIKDWPLHVGENFKNKIQERAFLPGVTAELKLSQAEAKDILRARYDEDDRAF